MIGRLKEPIEHVSGQAWVKDFRFWVGRTKAVPAQIAAGRAKLVARTCASPTSIELTVGAGNLIVSGNVVGVRATAGQMTLAAGVYDFEVTATLSDGSARNVRGVLDVTGAL